MCNLKKIKTVISLALFILITGCATDPAQKPLTPSQQRQIEKINAMQARWRNDDLADYSRAPGGYQAWQQLKYN